MKIDFNCPHCNAHLNVGDKVIFSIQVGEWEGVLALHRDLGNYTYSSHPTFKIKKGEVVEFLCPVCKKSLEAETHKNLAKMLMSDSKHKNKEVYFSRVTGEKCTYMIVDDVVEAYGKDKKKYMKFLNLMRVH